MNDTSYTKVLSSLKKIRTRTNASELHLPQITVIGDQSSGKSSLLTEISSIPFPVNIDITTKCPIIVETRRKDHAHNRYYLGDGDDAKEIKHADLERKILNVQVKNCGSSTVSSTPINILAEGPTLNDLVLVDLPGIVHDEEENKIVEMINTYIEPEQSLILVVTEAQRDNELLTALKLAKKADPDENRTMRVLTKFDSFGQDEQRTRAEKLIRSGTGKYRPHAVVCRSHGGGYDSSDENQQLGSLKSTDYAGVESLKKRLPQLLCKLIQTNLPELKNQVNSLLRESQNIIKEIGTAPPNSENIMDQVKSQLATNLELELATHMEEFQNRIRLTESIITLEWVDKSYQSNPFQCVFFQGDDTFQACITKYIALWTPILDSLHRRIGRKLDTHLPDMVGVSSTLRTAVKSSWSTQCFELMDLLRAEFDKEIEKEFVFKTMNHYITAKYKENMIMPEEVLLEIKRSIVYSTYAGGLGAPSQRGNTRQAFVESDVRVNIMKIIKTALEHRADTYRCKDLTSQHKERILAAVKANWAVSRKNFVDNVLSVVKTVTIGGKQKWLDTFKQDPKIRENACEDVDTKNRRKHHTERIEKMKQCEEELNKY